MVGRQSPPCERAPHSELPITCSNSKGCLQFGVGSSKQWGRHQGNMDTGRSQSSYQLQGTVGSIICSASLHHKSSKCPRLDSDRQYHNHCLYWCLERRIPLRAENFPGCLNTIADRESRAKLDTFDWYLNQNFLQT